MEFLIFGAVNLAAVAIFVALTALPFYVLYLVGRHLGSHLRRPAVRWWLPTIALALFITWLLASFSAFQQGCRSVPTVVVLSTAPAEPTGLALRGAQNTFVGTEFGWDAALQAGALQFVDLEYGRRCAGKKKHESQPEFPVEVHCDQSVPSQLAVRLLPPTASSHWWRPPLFETEIEVMDSRGRVLAKATDLVFGGGFLGLYMRLVGGDQDFGRLSCGFASQDIGPWRPSLASRPRFSQYREADLALLKAAMGKR